MADKPQVSEHSAVVSSGGSSFVGALIKKIIVLAILAGIIYGGWHWYQNMGGKDKISSIINKEGGSRSDKVEGAVDVGTDHKSAVEDALK